MYVIIYITSKQTKNKGVQTMKNTTLPQIDNIQDKQEWLQVYENQLKNEPDNTFVQNRLREVQADIRYALQQEEKKKDFIKNHKFENGEIYLYVWGYDCTIVDYYQVIKETAKTVWLAKLKKNITEEFFGGRYSEPIKNNFAEFDVIKKRKGERLSMPYGCMKPYKGEKIAQTDR